MIVRILDIVLWIAAIPVGLASAYLLALTLLSRRTPAPAPPPARLRFDIVVPAHDEEAGIRETVRSLHGLDYPAPLRRIVVVADNCIDATAERAREAGAAVIVRDEPSRRGKGHALALAFDSILRDKTADAVVVVDADTVVSPNLLAAFSERLEHGAFAIQARYGVSNPAASWRTRLMAIALALFHDVRSLGRERIRCSSGLRGNGMCFSVDLLRLVPHDALSVVEDLEYGIHLGRAGHRVWYADEASVLGEMVSGARASGSQRRRWEGGRLLMARAHAAPLLCEGLARRDRVLLDLAVDLLVPPLAYLGGAATLGLGVAAASSLLVGRPLTALWPWGASVAALSLYVTRGWWLSGTGLAGLAALARAPMFLAWKLAISAGQGGSAPREWVRTSRERRP